MPRFLDPERSVLLSTSFKVMYSTLRQYSHLRAVNELETVALLATRRIKRHVLFVRSPYDRLVSAWADKFRSHPLKLGGPNFGRWQKVQRLYLARRGVPVGASDEQIQAALLDIEFEEFVHLLPDLYRRDGHLFPQSWLCNVRPWGAIPLLPVPVDQVVQMERIDREAMLHDFALDFGSVRRNAVPHASAQDLFTSNLRRVANRIYESDFRKFHYTLD